MTARERAVVRAVIRALEGGSPVSMDALAVSYGINYHRSKPVKDRAAALLTALEATGYDS